MKLTRERALKLHRQMWSDMQKELGDNPFSLARTEYKHQWCDKYFPEEHIQNNCFLCEYALNMDLTTSSKCSHCPIKWDFGDCFEGYYWKKSYRNMPISELLALPEKQGV